MLKPALLPATRRARSRLLLGATALALAILGQGLVAGRRFVPDGLLLYLAALAIGLCTLDVGRGPAEDDPERGLVGGARLSSGSWLALSVAALTVVANVVALRVFGARANPSLAWVLYACSVVAAPAAVWLLSGRPPLRPAAGWQRADAVALGAILLVALFFRLYQIGSLPQGLWWDEAFSGLQVLRVMGDPGYRPVYVADAAQEPSLLWYTMVPFFWLFGPSPLGLRATALLGGTVGVGATFLLGRELFGRRAGVVAGAIVAVMAWHVNFSRIAFNAIWSVTLDALATYLLVQALRTRRLVSFALAGTALGLGANMYYTTRLMPVILGLYLLHRLAVERLAFLRRNLVGLLVFAGVTLVTVSPLAQFAILYAGEFNSRIEQITIFKEMAEKRSIEPLAESLRKHLLMLHYQGDPNGRHNLPGAPMLDQVVGALFVLGLGMALLRARRSECFLPLVWVPVMLTGGVLSVSFEAPQGLRTIDEITAVALLAALPLVALWDRLAGLPVGRVQVPVRLAGRELTRLSVASIPVVVLLAGVTALNYHRYFVQQAHDFATWNSFSTAQTEVARQLNELEGDYRVYLSDTLLGEPTIAFLSRKHADFARFDPAANLPLRDHANVAVFLVLEQERVAALLQRLYPQARVRTYRFPYGGPPILFSAIVPQSQVEALEGLAVRYYGSADWSGEPVRTERAGALDLDWSGGPPLRTPFSAELRATLAAPAYGRYVFKLAAPPGSELLLDETPLLRSGETSAAVLARGSHALRLRAVVPEPARVRLLWQPPDASMLAVVPREALFAPPVTNSGLLGSYYQNARWSGLPALQQIDPGLDIHFHLLPLQRPYSVEWKGKIDVPRDGVYRFAVESADASWIYVDGQLVATNDGAPRQLREGAIRLSDGFHDVRVRYLDETQFTFIRVYWTPPGGERQVIPVERLFPPQGAYPERAQELASLLETQATAPPPAPAAVGPAVAGALPVASYVEALRIGEPGKGDGQLLDPRGVAVDAQGYVYVADTGNARVQKFDQNGRFVAKWGPKGDGDADFVEPVAVAIDRTGNVVVLDAGEGWIKRFTPDGKLVDKLGGPAVAFYHPRGLGIGAQGNVVVADTGGSRLVELGPTGDVVGRYGTRGSAPGQLIEPTDVAAGGDGAYYVADSANSKVVRFDASWQPLAEWPVPKSGSVFGPHLAVAGPAGIFVSDPDGKRIVRYNAGGQALDQIGFEGQLDRPLQLAIDAAGNLFVADSGLQQVVKLARGS